MMSGFKEILGMATQDPVFGTDITKLTRAEIAILGDCSSCHCEKWIVRREGRSLCDMTRLSLKSNYNATKRWHYFSLHIAHKAETGYNSQNK